MTGSIIGFGAAITWRWLTFLEGHLFSLFPELPLFPPKEAFFLFTLFSGVTLLVLARYGRSLHRKTGLLTGLAGALLSAFSLMPLFVEGPLSGPAMVGLILSGAVGASLLLALWAWHSAALSPGRCALLFGGANVVGSLVVTVTPFIERQALAWFSLALPFLAVALWRPPRWEGGSATAASDQHKPGWAIAPFPAKLVLRVASFFFACSIFHVLLLASPSPNLYHAWKVTEPLYSTASLAMAYLIFRFPAIDLRYLYRWAQPVLGLGFLAFLVLADKVVFLPVALLQIGFGIFGTYGWVLLLYLAARAGRNRSFSVAARGQFIVAASVLAGVTLAKGTAAVAGRLDLPLLPSLSILGVTLLFLAGLAFDDDRETFAGYDVTSGPAEEDSPSSDPESAGQGYLLQAELLRFNLTRQESRVALLVGQQMANSDICCSLNITNNTVRTHLKNIYRKLEVSSREELVKKLASLATRQD
jgi:DNA-binding CsgD family transcriptional regulator